MIKFLNIKNQDKELHKVFIKDIKKIFINGDFILGSKVHEFEEKFAKYCGAKYSISCANGTDALTLALKCLDLPKNSEVILPAMTYCSTAFAVIEANLKPYDILPLIPIIKNSGAIVTNWKNEPAEDGGNILATSNKLLHNKILKLLKPFTKK